jgi:hypothetical protein
MGPGSSNTEETTPERIAVADVTSLIAGVGAYVYHSEAGVRGGLRGPPNLWEHRNAAEIATALKSARAVLAGDLANWNRTRHGLTEHAFSGSFACSGVTCAQIWPDGAASGVVRIYAARRGVDFFVHPIGIRGTVRLTPRRAMSFDVLDGRTFAVIAHHDLGAGADGDDHRCAVHGPHSRPIPMTSVHFGAVPPGLPSSAIASPRATRPN